MDTLTIAILAKDKASTLSLYLHCLLSQTFPKNQTHLYIRTNDNNDNTVEILKKFIDEHGSKYKEVYFDDSSINEKLKTFGNHEWNAVRFKILGKIRQDSINYAIKKDSWYFIADCDNFISPETIESLMSFNLPVVAPLLYADSLYSNYHADIDINGYYKECPLYHQLIHRQIRGIVEVPVIHCTYLIRPDVLSIVSYDDDSYRYEYVIFSDILRKNGVVQYLSNIDQFYGYIVFWEKEEDKEVSDKFKKFLDRHYSNWNEIIYQKN